VTKLNNNLNNFERRLSKKSARGRIQRVVPEAFRKSSSSGERPGLSTSSRLASARPGGGGGRGRQTTPVSRLWRGCGGDLRRMSIKDRVVDERFQRLQRTLRRTFFRPLQPHHQGFSTSRSKALRISIHKGFPASIDLSWVIASIYL
jgi:hypothetical protein